MRRVLYFAGHRLLVTEWEGKSLLASHRFEPTDEGRADFTEYVEKAANNPIQLLLDLIEEDFHRETIPATRGKDRTQLIQRRLDRYYRDMPYTHVESLGTDKDESGRKNETLLFSALTTTEQLAPWLDIIQQSKMPLAGIWSVPLLSRKLLTIASKEEANVLIVTRQVISALRESFFKQGKFQFSRQAKIPMDIRDSKDLSTYLSNVVKETEQTYRFLTNQRIIGFTDKLIVYCVIDDDVVSDAKTCLSALDPKEFPINDNIYYKFLGNSQLNSHFGLSAIDSRSKFSDILYTYLCSQLPYSSDHYFNDKNKTDFNRYRVHQGINWSAFALGIACLSAAAYFWLHSIETRQDAINANEQTALLERSYALKYIHIEDDLQNSESISESVDLGSKIITSSNYNLNTVFIALSELLSQPAYADLWLTNIHWSLASSIEITRLKQRHQEVTGEPNADEYDPYGASGSGDEIPLPEDEFPPEGGENTTDNQAIITLTGLLNPRDRSYTEIVNIVMDLQESMSRMSIVDYIFTQRIPVDVRPHADFRDQQGSHIRAEEIARRGIEDANVFEFIITVKHPDHG